MNGPRWSIIIFLACVAAVLAGLASLTFYTLGLERRDYQARADARHQETQRLVLWRMDSALTPLLTREASRPFFEYEPFVPADLGYGRIPGPIQPGQTLVPSPLLRPQEPLVKLYFTRSRQGFVASPQAPPAPLREIAESVYMSSYEIELAEQRVRAISELMGLGPSRIPPRTQPPIALGTSGMLSDAAPPASGNTQPPPTSAIAPPQVAQQSEVTQSANEYRARQQIADTLSQNRALQTAPGPDVSRRADKSPGSPGGASARPYPAEDQRAATSHEKSATPPAANDPPRRDDDTSTELAKSQSSSTDSKPGDAELAEAKSAAGDTTRSKDEDAAGTSTLHPRANELVFSAVASSAPGAAGTNLDAQSDPRFSNLLALAPMGPTVEVGRLTPRWFTTGKAREPELIFVREVVVEGERMEQGFWADWPALRNMLISNAGDLAPGATLRPLLAGVDESNPALLARTLAGIPAELSAGAAPIAQVPVWSPARLTLLITWIVSLLAILAIGMVLRAAMELAERRGRFVSAVTHELRTPLTTFCLYSQMLADGLIQGEDARATYLQTLKSESQRLARIVESVLEYARLGHKRPGQVRTLQSVQRLIDQVAPPLAQRCTQAGMALEVSIEASHNAAEAMVAADAPTIERILYNLVDNACKYAAASTDPRVHLIAHVDSSGVVFSVRDHGPGIDPAERPRVFRAFVRGTREAAGTIPGLGLGLSLAQGLAREIGAELRLEPAPQGARFDLRLPLA